MLLRSENYQPMIQVILSKILQLERHFPQILLQNLQSTWTTMTLQTFLIGQLMALMHFSLGIASLEKLGQKGNKILRILSSTSGSILSTKLYKIDELK